MLAAPLTLAQPDGVTVIYVDPDATGANDGTSWANAFAALQDALDAAVGPDYEIWVAEGVHYPDLGATHTDNNSFERFELKSDVPLFGGFVGTETARDERNPDPNTNNTILSGDIGGGQQSRNVVYAENITGTVVDGFTVSGASNVGVPEQGAVKAIAADQLFLVNLRVVENAGVGIHIRGTSDVTLDHVEIADNGDIGIGVDDITTSDDATVLLVDSIIRGNGDIGGVFGADAIVTVINTLVSGHNAAGSKGFTNSGLLTVQFCTFTDNGTPTQVGGGIANGGTSGPRGMVVTGSLFEGNHASLGGGIHNTGAAIVVGNTFLGNDADQQGGGVYNHAAAASLELHNSYFLGNTAGNRGGAIANFAEFDAMNLVMAGNAATFFGGGLYNDGTATLRNTTVYGNSADVEGGGAYNDTGDLTVLNSVFYGDSAPSGPEIFNALFATTSVGHSDIQGGLAGSTDLGNNIDAEPAFLDADGPDDQLGTLDDDFDLMPGSPLIDVGNNDYLLPDFLDLDGDGERTGQEPWPNDVGVTLHGWDEIFEDPPSFNIFDNIEVLFLKREVCVHDAIFPKFQTFPLWFTATIFWGDGTSMPTDTRDTYPHAYSEAGPKTIVFVPVTVVGESEPVNVMIEVLPASDPTCERDRQLGFKELVDLGAREAFGTTVANEPAPGIESFRLEAPTPNPAYTRAELVIHLAEAEPVRLAVYDVLGREVARLHDGPLAAGRHPFVFESRSLPAGIYLIRATGPSFQATQPLTLVR
ncbi:MAG: hypothetical protein HKN04_11035 [Rhodothermaceae bacterium]|nr:hypothetical protein [Rhodothermaceae bacterium]